MGAKEWVEVGQSLSVLFATVTALYGIDAWRREFVAKRKIELAEEVLALFYQAKDAIAAIRSPVGFGGEGKTRKRGEQESAKVSEALDQAYVLIERYYGHSELFSRLQVLRYRFKAQHGIDAAKPFDDLGLVVNKLVGSARTIAMYTGREFHFPTQAQADAADRQLRDAEKVYYAGFEDDPIAPEVDGILGVIEQTCRAIIESRGTLFSWLNVRVWGRK